MFAKHTAQCYQYSNIPLKVYLEIAENLDLSLLILSGEPSEEQLQTTWKDIIVSSTRANGNMEYDYQLNMVISYRNLLKEYNTIRAVLTKLMFVIDDELISILTKKRYKIDTSYSSKYWESLTASWKRCDNMSTRLGIMMSQIKAEFKEKNNSSQHETMEEVLGSISYGIGFNVEDNVTLARFNKYKHLLKKKSETAPVKAKSNGRA